MKWNVMCVAVMLLILLHALPLCAEQTIYRRAAAAGSLEFSDQPHGTGWKSYIEPHAIPPLPGHDSFDDYILAAALDNGIDPVIVRGVIAVESDFNPGALSPKGAVGLMQLMPETAADMGCQNPWNPEENIRAGSRYLAWLLKRYDGDLTLALAAYNAGPTVVDTCGGIPPYQETQQYVKNVLAFID